MKRILMALMGLAVLFFIMVGGVLAQDDPDIQLSSITFEDGSVLRYPLAYELVSEDSTSAQLNARNISFYIRLFTTQERTTLGITEPIGAMEQFIAETDGFDLDVAELAQVISTNGVDVTWLRYDDQNFPGTLQAIELPSGAVIVIDAYGAFYNSRYEAVALAMLSDMAKDNTSFLLDSEALPSVPFDPQPVIERGELTEYTFSDDSIVRFSADFQLEDDFERRDFLAINAETATFYLDYFLPDDIKDMELEDVIAVMAASYQPLDENSRPLQPEEVQQTVLGDVELFYWRYDDQGATGLVLAVTFENGSVLVLDAFGAHPASIDEDYAVALLLDFAGNPDLLNGIALERASLGEAGLDDLSQGSAE